MVPAPSELSVSEWYGTTLSCRDGCSVPDLGGTLCDRHLASPCRPSSLLCQPSCCAARQARRFRNPHRILRYPPCRSKRRSQDRLLRRRRGQRPRPPTTATNGHQALRPLKGRSSGRIQRWGGLPGWSDPPAVATVVAKPAIESATPPGLDVAMVPGSLSPIISRQRAGTR